MKRNATGELESSYCILCLISCYTSSLFSKPFINNYIYINLYRCMLAVVFMLCYLSAEEYLFLLLPICKRSHLLTHPPLTYHLSREFCHPLNVISSTCSLMIEGNLLCSPTTHQDS